MSAEPPFRTDRESARRPRRWKRLMGGCAAAVLLLLLLVWFLGGYLARTMVEQALAERLGEPVRIGAVRISLLFGCEIRMSDLAVGADPEKPLLTAARAEARFGALSALWGETTAVSFDLEQPVLHVSEEGWAVEAPLARVLARLLAEEGGRTDWEVPVGAVKNLSLDCDLGEERRIAFAVRELEIRNLASAPSASAAPAVFRLKHLELGDGAGALLAVKECAAEVRLDSDGAVRIPKLALKGVKLDESLARAGATRLDALASALSARLSPLLPEAKAGGQGGVTLAAIGEVKAEAVALSLRDERHEFAKGEIVLGIQSAELMEASAESAWRPGRIRMEGLDMTNRREDGGQAARAVLAVAKAEWKDPAPFLRAPEVELAGARLTLERGYESGATGEGGDEAQFAAFARLLLAPREGTGAGRNAFARLVCEGGELDLQLLPGRGLSLPRILAVQAGQWLAALGVSLGSDASAPAAEGMESANFDRIELSGCQARLYTPAGYSGAGAGAMGAEAQGIVFADARLSESGLSFDSCSLSFLQCRAEAGGERLLALALESGAGMGLGLDAFHSPEAGGRDFSLAFEEARVSAGDAAAKPFLAFNHVEAAGSVTPELWTVERLAGHGISIRATVSEPGRVAEAEAFKNAQALLNAWWPGAGGEGSLPLPRALLFRSLTFSDLKAQAAERIDPARPQEAAAALRLARATDLRLTLDSSGGVVSAEGPLAEAEGISFTFHETGREKEAQGVEASAAALSLRTLALPARAGGVSATVTASDLSLAETGRAEGAGGAVRLKSARGTLVRTTPALVFDSIEAEEATLRSACDLQRGEWDFAAALARAEFASRPLRLALSSLAASPARQRGAAPEPDPDAARASAAVWLRIGKADLTRPRAFLFLRQASEGGTARLEAGPERLRIEELLLGEAGSAFASARFETPWAHLAPAKGTPSRLSARTVTLTGWNSAALALGRGSFSVTMEEAKTEVAGEESGAGYRTLATARSLATLWRELSADRAALTDAQALDPAVDTAIDETGGSDLFRFLNDWLGLVLAEETAQAGPVAPAYPVTLDRVRIERGSWTLSDAKTGSPQEPARLSVSEIAAEGKGLVYGERGAGELTATAFVSDRVAGSAPGAEARAGALSLAAGSLDLSQGLERASGGARLRLSGLPAGAAHPFTKRYAGLSFQGGRGSLSVELRATSRAGALDGRGDVGVRDIVPLQDPDFVAERAGPMGATLGNVFGVLTQAARVRALLAGSGLTYDFPDAFFLRGTLAAPEVRANESAVRDVGELLKGIFSLPKRSGEAKADGTTQPGATPSPSPAPEPAHKADILDILRGQIPGAQTPAPEAGSPAGTEAAPETETKAEREKRLKEELKRRAIEYGIEQLFKSRERAPEAPEIEPAP